MQERVRAIDGLRGIAALSVLVFHLWLYTRPLPVVTASLNDGFDRALNELRLGLVLFFVLTGFLLFQPWLRATLTDSERPAIGSYFIRRVVRIVPAYYLALLGSIALLWPAAGTPGVRLPNTELLPLFFVFGQNFSSGTIMKLDPPTWTLCIEVGFYLVAPLLGWLILRLPPRRSAQALLPIALLTLGVLWNWAVLSFGSSLLLTKSLPAMLPYFAVGMLAAIYTHDRRLSRSASQGTILIGILLALGWGLWHATSGEMRPLRDFIAAAGFALIIAALASGSGRNRITTWKPLVAVGTVSYGLFLWHVPLILWLRSEGLLPSEPLTAGLIVLPLSLLVAALSWRLVERPVIAVVSLTVRRRAPASTHTRPTVGSDVALELGGSRGEAVFTATPGSDDVVEVGDLRRVSGGPE